MNSNELRSGDLVFSFNSNNESEHIALYAGHKDGVPYVLHATSKPHNAIMLTRLIPADEGCSYHVMRALDTDLSQEVRRIFLDWVEHKVPYASTEKVDRILNLMDKLGGIDTPYAGEKQEEFGKASYQKNYAYYFQMAHYLPYIPVTHTSSLKIEGLRCCEAIVAAFNIALLMRHATYLNNQWTLGEGQTLEAFVSQLNNPLPFDASASLSAGVYRHCSHTPAHWINCGMMDLLPSLPHSPENKVLWHEFKDALNKVGMENTAQFLKLSNSPKIAASAQQSLFKPLTELKVGQDILARSISFSPDISVAASPIAELRRSPFYTQFFQRTRCESADSEVAGIFGAVGDRARLESSFEKAGVGL